ncbi:MAG: hypothetical protein Q9191_006077 [Dirinaria sp. TL-2023a]
MACETSTGPISREDHGEMDPSTGTLWWPANYALSEERRSKKALDRHVLIVLNVPLTEREYVRSLLSSGVQIPDAICGDFDSLPPDVEDFYRRIGSTEFVKDTDQYSTDFMKCLKHIAVKAKTIFLEALGPGGESDAPGHKLDIVVLGGLDGRADQAFSQIHHLYAANDLQSPYIGKTYLATAKSIMFLLEEGCNVIRTPVGPGLLAETVGVIPIGRPSVITTQGLEWDVTQWPTELGGQISTSNHIKREVVHVTTSNRALFTVELAKLDEASANDAKNR